MGIAEYWILDYQGLGGRRYIGSPKQPTATNRFFSLFLLRVKSVVC